MVMATLIGASSSTTNQGTATGGGGSTGGGGAAAAAAAASSPLSMLPPLFSAFWLGVLLSFLIGLSLGLLGGGGSILTVPILVYVLNVPPKKAIAMSLIVVGVTSSFALIPHARAGNVNWKMGLIFGAAGMVGSFAGGLLAAYVSARLLMILFAIMTLATATAMLLKKEQKSDDELPLNEPTNGASASGPLELGTGPAAESNSLVTTLNGSAGGEEEEHPLWRIIADGFVVGVITGLIGAGGGFLVVPALVLLAGLSVRKALGTSLLVIAMKSFAGFFGHALHESVDGKLAALVSVTAVAGSFVGGQLTSKVNQATLRKSFAVFVLVVGTIQLTLEVMGR